MFTSLHSPQSTLNWSNLSSLGKLYTLLLAFIRVFLPHLSLFLRSLPLQIFFSFFFSLSLQPWTALRARYSQGGAADNRTCLGGCGTWWSFLTFGEFSRTVELNTSSDWADWASWCQTLLPLKSFLPLTKAIENVYYYRTYNQHILPTIKVWICAKALKDEIRKRIRNTLLIPEGRLLEKYSPQNIHLHPPWLKMDSTTLCLRKTKYNVM